MTDTITFENDDIINVLRIFKDLHDICTLNFKKDAIYAKFMDKNLVSVIDMKLDCYKTNKLKTERQITFNLEDILKIFGCKKRDSYISFKFNSDNILIKFIDESKKYEKYKLKLVNIEDENELGDGEIQHGDIVSIKMFSEELSNICKKITKFDDTMAVVTSGDKLFFNTAADENVEIFFGVADDENIKIGNDVRINLMTKYMNIFTKCDKLSDIVTINMEDDETPIEMVYEFENSIIRFYLSPQND